MADLKEFIPSPKRQLKWHSPKNILSSSKIMPLDGTR